MPYSDQVLRRARARLAAARANRDQENDLRIAAIYDAHPRLREIDRQLRATVAQVMTAAFRRGEDPTQTVEQMRKANLELQRERAWILESEGIDESDLKAEPICAVCGGTGYVGERMCECLAELCRQEQKKELSSLLSGNERFDAFRLDLYPDMEDANLGGYSPRAIMRHVYERCRRYAAEFSVQSPSLLLSGGTGLGKTFLSAAIARTVTDGGYAVVYETAGQVFSDFEAEKFGGSGHGTAKYLHCDLLILDDLGTEMTTQFTLSALYSLVNGRLMAGLPTIISTNLTTNEIRQRYTPQIASRLLGTYELLLFAGNDIRLLKKT